MPKNYEQDFGKKKQYVFTFHVDDGKYTLDASQLEEPLLVIFSAFENDFEITDTHYQLTNALESHILEYDKRVKHGLDGSNTVALSHTIGEFMRISQVLGAISTIFNSLKFVEEKEKRSHEKE